MTGRTCYLAVRDRPEYPRREIVTGVEAHGDVVKGAWGEADPVEPGRSVGVWWHLHGHEVPRAAAFRARGGAAVVVENGYIRASRRGETLYSWGRDLHNDPSNLGLAPPGVSRVKRLGLHGPEPWRPGGSYVLVCGQRGGEYSDLAMPSTWPADVVARIRKITDRPIWFRAHPEAIRTFPVPGAVVVDPRASFRDHLSGAYVVVVWTSAVAVEAVARGVPAIYEGPRHVLAPVTGRRVEEVEYPPRPTLEDVAEVFRRLSWLLWSRSEVAAGDPWAFVTNGTARA